MAQEHITPDMLETPPSLTTMSGSNDAEDSDEWEYEYSTTETETYYVTLDLTQPGMTQKRLKKTKLVGRVGKNLGWVDPGRQQLQVAQPDAPAAEDAEDAQGGEDDADGDLAHEASKPTVVEDIQIPRVTEVQILDLETSTPVVSYGGKVYNCRWEQNIGTELLFMKHNPNDPLPVVRSLPQGVDLLAASSVRIVSQPVHLEAKEDERSVSPAPREQTGTGPRFKIPIGHGASTKRKEQGRFLEKIMALKVKKGERDAVTVIAQRRKSKKQWERQYEDQRKQERNKLAQGLKKGGKTAERAQERLQAMDKEDADRGFVMTKSLRGRPAKFARENKSRPGRAKKSVTLNRHPTVFEQQQHGFGADDLPDSVMGTDYGDGLSVPTPQRWSDLEEDTNMVGGEAAYEDADMYDETGPANQGAEEPYNGEDNYDEDAPGEIDDTQQYEWQY
ncbi:hypothetical protein PVAG01_03336 [Phlyctema vagabunda]|uniref:Transcription factor TFIIIC triple barrel domain-containing protein n=1 Tax=Phlyctema vagabunda TaxID=108571 RepID=A0ABR4PL81_9HELO